MAKILLGVTGGIAIYKSLELIRLYIKNGHEVRVMMSAYAEKFITPMTFEVISQNKVLTHDNEVALISHIDMVAWADICVIAPATANTIAKISSGIADSPMLSTILALRSPLLLAPSMNTFMYQNIITQRNISELKRVGVNIIEPASGMLACGDDGVGKLPDVNDIYEASMRLLAPINSSLRSKLKGKRVLITGGGTLESIDPVRYIGNHSSGKMGLALAEVALSLGAEVKFIVGKVDCCISFPDMVTVKSADEMYNALKGIIADYDILIMSAAVADYRVDNVSDEKMKKSDSLELKLIKNIDILSELSKTKRKGQLFVGFAAESNDIERNALAKLESKRLDMIIANDIKRNDIGFNSDMNEVLIFTKSGKRVKSERSSKRRVAEVIFDEVLEILKS